MAKKTQSDSAVGRPLSPAVLTELGALEAPPPPGPFDPGGAWTASYRIWTCYGHRDKGNVPTGELRIERRAEGGAIRLAVSQTLRNSEGKLHGISAAVACRGDALCSPTDWTLRSEFAGQHMDGLPAIALEQAGRIADGAWETTFAGKRARRTVEPPVTADWCLFEAVQRMGFRREPAPRFSLLEGLTVLKADHRLAYAGSSQEPWGGAKLPMHRFVQLGRGVYPYDYWLDEQHRLLLVTTGPRAYIAGAETGGSRR